MSDRPLRSENPLTLSYWTGVVDARPLAIFRIALGIVLLVDLASIARELSTFLTDDGVYPRRALAGGGLSLFSLTGSTTSVAFLIALGATATLAFTLGYFTRAATVACWVFWVSLHRRLPIVMTAGDFMVGIFFFFGMFADLSGRWSLDAWRRGERDRVPALAPRFMAAFPALLYLFTARQKLLAGGAEWWFGSVIFKTMQAHGWLRPPGVWLEHYPVLCALLTGSTIIFELAIPFLYFSPVAIRPARALAVLANLALQIGILLTMRVGIFTYVMFAVTSLWLQPEWLDAIGGRLARKGISETPRWSPGHKGLAGALSLFFLFAITTPVMPRHLPRFVPHLVDFMGLVLPTSLFTHGFPSIRWEASGTLADGSRVDPLPVADSTCNFEPAYFNTLWMQLPYVLDDLSALGPFVCDRYNRASPGDRLERWRLVRATRDVYAPSEPVPEEHRSVLLEQTCQR